MQQETSEMYSRLVFDGQADDGTDLERIVRRMAELLGGGATVDDVLAQVVSNAEGGPVNVVTAGDRPMAPSGHQRTLSRQDH